MSADCGVEVGLVEGYAPEALTGTWDLVVGMYAPVHSDPVKLGKLLGAVAPGGHLLFVHHEMPDDFFEGVDWSGDAPRITLYLADGGERVVWPVSEVAP